MEAVGSSLPEFIIFRNYEIAVPEIGGRHFAVGKSRCHFFGSLIESFPIGQECALAGGPCPDTASARTIGEVNFRFGSGEESGFAIDPDLPFHRFPIKEKGDRGVGGDMGCFFASRIGEEAKTALIISFEQDDPRGDLSPSGDRGKNHGGRFKDIGGLLGFIKPEMELSERVGVQIGSSQLGAEIGSPPRGDIEKIRPLFFPVSAHDRDHASKPATKAPIK